MQDLESSQIEVAALRAALQALRAQGVSVLTHDGTLPLGETTDAGQMAGAAPKGEVLDEAFVRLAAQSREVAKLRRSG